MVLLLLEWWRRWRRERWSSWWIWRLEMEKMAGQWARDGGFWAAGSLLAVVGEERREIMKEREGVGGVYI